MKAYELLFFVDPSLDPETRLAVMKRIDTTIVSSERHASGHGATPAPGNGGHRRAK